MNKAAIQAGAPDGLMSSLSIPTIEGTSALMKDDNIAVILATGSTPMVKAAYSAGTPAYGVGAGNVPAFIEKTADYKKAVADIVKGTTFDNGVICSSEQSIIVDRPLKDQVIEAAKANKCYFVNKDEKRKLEQAISRKGKINPEIVGKSATFIANYAGFSVPNDTEVLIAECSKVGPGEPLSMEKLSPTLAFYVVDGWLDGCHKCIELLEFGGIGHTLAIHSNDEEIILKFALEKPAFRIIVNSPSSLGAVGYTTALIPSMTLGVGTWGGSIISENVTAKHLLNIKTLAFETNPINAGNAITSFGSYKKAKKVAGSGTFLEKIENNLLARAGNTEINPFGVFKKDDPSKKPNKLGSGISEDEIEKIIKEFNS
jgi:acetaldehyde dehydrogenase (acetylating)